MTISHIEVYRYALPLVRPLVLRGGTLSKRSGYLVRLETSAGLVAWGDAAPLPGFSRDSPDDARSVLTLCAERAIGEPLAHALSNAEAVECARSPAASFAWESACLALAAQETGRPMASMLRENADQAVPLNALLTGSQEDVLARAEKLPREGFQAAKLKVGLRRMEAEAETVHALRETLGPDIRLRLDANRAWDLETAVGFAEAVADARIEYVEEPLANPLELPAFGRQAPVPFALDESFQAWMPFWHPFEGISVDLAEIAGYDAAAIEAMAAAVHGASALVWKPTLVYRFGLATALLMFRERSPNAHPVVVSASFESGVGIAALAHYAAVVSWADTPVGLDTYSWLRDDVLGERLPLPGATLSLADATVAWKGVEIDRLERVWDAVAP